MTYSRKNKIRAILLLAVFSFNTALGFACSVGLDMGFNSKHHHNGATESVVHTHKNGKKHIHYGKKASHTYNKTHHQDPLNDHQKSKKEKDDCCNDKVMKLEQLDKSVPQSLNIIHPNFFISFFDLFYNVSLPTTDIVKNIKQFVRNYHPPIPDVRIAIQSFQI